MTAVLEPTASPAVLDATDQAALDAAYVRLRPFEQAALTRLMVWGEVKEGSPSDGDWARAQ